MLPYSNESLDLCEIVEWQGPITRRHIWFSGQNILGRFNVPEEQKLIGLASSVEPIPASFSTIKLDKSGITDIAASIPNIGVQFEGKLETEKIVSFTFENCSVKRLEDSVLERILDVYGALDKRKQRRLRKTLFLSQLYYSEKVIIEAKSVISGNIEAELKSHNAHFKHKRNHNGLIRN